MMNILTTMIMLNILIGMCVMVGAISKMPAAAAAPILNEAQALMAFKAGINKDPFGRLQSWHVIMPNHSSPCQEGRLLAVAPWAGIVCDSQMQHVIAVNLRSFDLTGSVSPSLAFLTALSRLDLSHNLLYGKLPNTLFAPHSPQLRYLNLSHNSLEGDLPNSFTNLSALVVLDLSYNKFVGALPASLGQLQNLEVLILERPGRDLKGDIANEIWRLPVLRKLRIIGDVQLLHTVLPYNFGFCGTITQLHLEGLSAGGSAIPSSLGDCHKLEHLAFKDVEGLRGFIPPQIWQLPLLQTLIINVYDIRSLSGLLPDSFAFCHTIIHLELGFFNGTGSSIPSSLGVCHHLEVLVLWDVVGLQGFIPLQIWQLPSLQTLHISAHQEFANDNSDNVLQFSLHGTLPPYFSFCHSLTELFIFAVNLTGTIPSSLGQCTSLQILALYYDNLQGSIPTSLQNLTELQVLDFGSNNLTGGIPPSMLSECSQLHHLWLGENKYLGGSIPRQLGELTQLQDLDLSGTSLSGPMPEELCNCTQLTSLSVGTAPAVKSGGIAGNIPDCLGRLAQLRYLRWDYNSINGKLPMTVLKNLTQLEELSMNHAQLRGSIPHEPAILGNLSQLMDLSLAGNELSGIIPQPFIREFLNLQWLDLSKNQFSGEIPNEIGALAFLTVLDLSQNKLLNGALPKSLENCSNLRILRLFQNNLTGQIEHFDFSKLPHLQTFTVQQNNFTGGLPSSFTKSPNLLLFDVQGNRLSGSFNSIDVAMHQELMQIGGLSQLRVLVMSYNNLSGKIPSWLWKLPMLQVLDLSNNHFSGTMPSSVNSLTYFKQDQTQNKNQSTIYEKVPQTIKFASQVLTYILNTRISFDVSMNHLEGEISESFGELLGLTTLNLSHNRIRGNIPASLGKLVSLDVLDLSNNSLTGGIPEELGRIGGLSTVDFSYNNLEGRIPTTGDFNTRFDERSFAHNARLCGAPLATSTCSHDSGRTMSSTSTANLSLGSEGAQNYAKKVIKWFGGFTSPWGLLLGYTVGFLGVLYLRHRPV